MMNCNAHACLWGGLCLCRVPCWCGRVLGMEALLPPGVLVCFVPLLGFFITAGPLQCAGPLGVLDWVTMWPCCFVASGAFCPPVFGLFGAWLLGVDTTAAVAPFFTLFLLNFIKSPPLSTDRDTGMHTISIPMVTFLFNGISISVYRQR